MSRDRNFSFPPYINRYYDDAAFHKIVDTMYDLIHSGEFSAKHLHEAVELAENKEIMYGNRVMPTATTGPMPGEKPKATEPANGDRSRCLKCDADIVFLGEGTCKGWTHAVPAWKPIHIDHSASPRPRNGDCAVCDRCEGPIFFGDGIWRHYPINSFFDHKATPWRDLAKAST